MSALTISKEDEKVEGTVHFIGIVLLLGLMIFVTMNDITRIFGN